jgi:hypothetical protein
MNLSRKPCCWTSSCRMRLSVAHYKFGCYAVYRLASWALRAHLRTLQLSDIQNNSTCLLKSTLALLGKL